MHIAIKYQHPLNVTVCTQTCGRVGKVIENTKACAMRMMRVMRATSRMAGHAMGQCMPCRQQGPVYRKERPVGENLAPCQTQHPLGFTIQRAVCNGINIACILCQRQSYGINRFGLQGNKLPDDAVRMQPADKTAEFCCWKSVPVG